MKPASDNAEYDAHQTDPERLRMEIAKDFGREYLRREFKYKGFSVIVLKENFNGPFTFKIEGKNIRKTGQAETGAHAEALAKAVLDKFVS